MKVYKYRHLDRDGHYRQILENNRLFFASPDRLNDPYECRPLLVPGGDKAAVEAYVERLERKWGAHLGCDEQRRLKEAAVKRILSEFEREETFYWIVRSYGIQSFSADPTSLLMWAHYAQNHEGFCIEFALRDQESGPLGNLWEVEYVDERPTVAIVTDAEDREVLFRRGLATKSKVWGYEREYRAINLDGPGPVRFDPSLLTGVILGARIARDKRDEVLRLCSERSPRPMLFQAVLRKETFGIALEQIPS
jgi:hypothetical protein